MGDVAKDRDWFVEKDRIGVPTWKEVRSRISIARLTWPRIDVKRALLITHPKVWSKVSSASLHNGQIFHGTYGSLSFMRRVKRTGRRLPTLAGQNRTNLPEWLEPAVPNLLSFPEENNGSLKKIPKLDDPSQYSRLGLVEGHSIILAIPQEIIDTHELQTITFVHRRECQRNDIVDSLVSPEFSDDGSTNGAVDSDPHLNDQDLQEFLHLLRLSGSGLKIMEAGQWRKLAR
ncbi:hypothetical protein ZIOFF_012252 [Zingiber officinale]|uniref:Acyl-ACP thioesterase-like C-terminal domain-containing protein n=1 Tax=Zingiber officinale TaxID=94328 RepID=A0A8J5I747_ZINOF|nr:hypothetical protein ZIOFF_012252 [Zingiber officinale]